MDNPTPARREERTKGRTENEQKSTRWRKWAALFIAAVILVFAMSEVIDPFGDEPYIAIPHGDHVHYVPEDRNPNVPLSSFPTQKPGPNERITPTGQVVPIDE